MLPVCNTSGSNDISSSKDKTSKIISSLMLAGCALCNVFSSSGSINNSFCCLLKAIIILWQNKKSSDWRIIFMESLDSGLMVPQIKWYVKLTSNTQHNQSTLCKRWFCISIDLTQHAAILSVFHLESPKLEILIERWLFNSRIWYIISFGSFGSTSWQWRRTLWK